MPKPTLPDLTKRVDCPRCGCKNAERVIDGAKLRQFREGAGLSLRAVADRMEVSPAFLSDVELGRRNLTEQRALKFLSAINGG